MKIENCHPKIEDRIDLRLCPLVSSDLKQFGAKCHLAVKVFTIVAPLAKLSWKLQRCIKIGPLTTYRHLALTCFYQTRGQPCLRLAFTLGKVREIGGWGWAWKNIFGLNILKKHRAEVMKGQRTGRPWQTRTMGSLRRKHKMKMSWVVEEVALFYKVELFKVLSLLIFCNITYTKIDFLIHNLVVAFCQCCAQYKRNCSTL